MYYNADYDHFIYFSSENYRDCAARIVSIYQIFKSLEEAEERKKTPPDENKSASGGEKIWPYVFVKHSFYEVFGYILSITNKNDVVKEIFRKNLIYF